jgi:hypothetical protein
MVATVGALAQGQVNFNNRVVGVVDVKVFDTDGTTGLAGDVFTAGLYTGAAGAAEGTFALSGATAIFRTGAGAGYFIGGVRTTAFPGNTAIQAQVRAWETSGGASYELASAAGKKVGKSNILTVTVTEAPNTPPDLVGLQSFSLAGGVVIPEPSTIALGVLGAAALLLRRRK